MLRLIAINATDGPCEVLFVCSMCTNMNVAGNDLEAWIGSWVRVLAVVGPTCCRPSVGIIV